MSLNSSPEIGASELAIAQKLNSLIYTRRPQPTVPAAPEKPAAELTYRPPGVYFGLPMDAYHREPALGSSDLRRLLVAPAHFWFHSKFNPHPPFVPESHAKLKGRALHKLVLEGEAAFDKAFAESPSPEGHPGALVTHEDLKSKCRELGEAVTGTKAELGKRIKQA